MHVDNRSGTLSREDETLVDRIDEILAGTAGTTGEPAGLESFCARLARTVPEADPVFRQRLEERVLEAAGRRTAHRVGELPRFRLRLSLTPTPLRSVLAAGLVAALMLAAFVVDPSARAWADANVTRSRFNLGCGAPR